MFFEGAAGVVAVGAAWVEVVTACDRAPPEKAPAAARAITMRTTASTPAATVVRAVDQALTDRIGLGASAPSPPSQSSTVDLSVGGGESCARGIDGRGCVRRGGEGSGSANQSSRSLLPLAITNHAIATVNVQEGLADGPPPREVDTCVQHAVVHVGAEPNRRLAMGREPMISSFSATTCLVRSILRLLSRLERMSRVPVRP